MTCSGVARALTQGSLLCFMCRRFRECSDPRKGLITFCKNYEPSREGGG